MKVVNCRININSPTIELEIKLWIQSNMDIFRKEPNDIVSFRMERLHADPMQIEDAATHEVVLEFK